MRINIPIHIIISIRSSIIWEHIKEKKTVNLCKDNKLLLFLSKYVIHLETIYQVLSDSLHCTVGK